MITLKQITEACDFRITGGTEYQWPCYGTDARFLEFSDQDGLECVSIVFDSKTQVVYEVNLAVPGYEQAFGWRNPDYEEAYQKTCKERHVAPNVAWDDVMYARVDEVTMLAYAKDVVSTYYDDLPVPETTDGN
jgi:hypothetical protein